MANVAGLELVKPISSDFLASQRAAQMWMACPVGKQPLTGGGQVTVTSNTKPMITRSELSNGGWLVEAAWPAGSAASAWRLSVTVLCVAIHS